VIGDAVDDVGDVGVGLMPASLRVWMMV
jgi:hypothetical protein